MKRETERQDKRDLKIDKGEVKGYKGQKTMDKGSGQGTTDRGKETSQK